MVHKPSAAWGSNDANVQSAWSHFFAVSRTAAIGSLTKQRNFSCCKNGFAQQGFHSAPRPLACHLDSVCYQSTFLPAWKGSAGADKLQYKTWHKLVY
jgi:hypothetical protein